MSPVLSIVAVAIVLAAVPVAHADEMNFDGAVKIGGVFRDETGDRSTVQETYNLHDGFTISSLYLKGKFNDHNYLRFDISNINLPNRIGTLEYRVPGKLRLHSRFTQNRQVFDPKRAVESDRKTWGSTLAITANPWLELLGDYTFTKRTGDRVGYPGNVESALGSRYNFVVNTGRVAAEVKRDAFGLTVAVDASSLNDNENSLNDRDATILSGNLILPGFRFKRLTHVARGAIGQSRLPTSDVKFDLYTFQYTGVLATRRDLQLKYRFFVNRVDDEATDMPTDNWIHDVDATYYYRLGAVSAGYGWEARDDDRVITTYNNYRIAATIRTSDSRWRARAAYRNRLGDDKEKLTLLKDSEWQQANVKVDGEIVSGLRVGGLVAQRRRDLPDIRVKLEGITASIYSDYRMSFSEEDPRGVQGYLRVDASYADDDYTNIAGMFRSVNRFVTGRAEATRADWRGGVSGTYLNVGGVLDIQKWITGVWLGYTFQDRWTVDARYNVYSFDDYVINDRFYTGNFVWVDFGYKFRL